MGLFANATLCEQFTHGFTRPLDFEVPGRRRLCPTIHQWESRIKDTISPEDWPLYEIVRGRVAAGYVHMMVNGHRDHDAMETVREFGDKMPSSRIAGWLRYAAEKGGLTWKGLCSLIRLKEQFKGMVYSLTSSF